MPTLKECLALVLIALLSVLSVASPVAAFERQHHHYEKAEPVTVTNTATKPVPVSVQGTPGVAVTNTPTVMIGNDRLRVDIMSGGGGGTVGGGAAALPEDGAQFTKHNTTGQNFVMFMATDLQRTGKRLVVDFLTVQAGGNATGDCSLIQVRSDDATGTEMVRSIVTLHGNASGLWGGTTQVKMFIDPGSRLLAIGFPGCDATDLMMSVVGHYIDH